MAKHEKGMGVKDLFGLFVLSYFVSFLRWEILESGEKAKWVRQKQTHGVREGQGSRE